MAEEIKLPIVPEFPTAYGETEQQRLDILAKQKTQMEEIYRTKFAEQAWSRVPFPEKAVRGLVSGTVFEPLISAVTPWQWGFDYGLTPEEAQKKMLETEAEYSELLRMQRVVTILPSIQNTLRILALTNATIVTTREELDKYFKLTNIGFTEEEQAYVVDFARSLLATPKEDLVSGEPLGLLPITAEEIESLIGGDRPIIRPSQILSTVAFSTDLDQIQQALQQAYPPIGGELDATKGKEVLLQQYLDALKNLGVDTEGMETLPEMAAQAFEAISESKGWVMPTGDDGLPLIDPATNQTVVYVIDKEGYAWYGESLIGYYDEGTNKLAPVSLLGEPILTNQQEENVLKDWWDALYLSLAQSWHMGKQYILNTIPQAIVSRIPGHIVEGESTISKVLNFSIYKFIAEKIMGVEETDAALKEKEEILGSRLEQYMEKEGLSYGQLEGLSTEEQIRTLFDWTKASMTMKGEKLPEIDEKLVSYLTMVDDISNLLKKDYESRELGYYEWIANTIKEHPELLPRPEWDEPMIDRVKRNPAELLDVGYLGYHLMSNVHTYLAVAASIGTTYVTGNPLVGMATAITLFTPLETESLKRDLIDSGATYEQASALAAPAGAFISSLESIGNIPVLKAFAPQFFASFKRNLIQGIAGRLLQYGVITPAKITAAETLEEILQEAAHNAFVKTVDEERHLLENVPEVVLQSIFTMAPLAFFGGGAEYINMKNYLPPDVQDKLNSDSQNLQDTGIPKDQADLIAYNNLVETETGQAYVNAAVEEMAAEIPHTKWDTYTSPEVNGMTWDEWESTTASTEDFAAKIINLESEIGTLNEDIKNQESLLEERETKLAKLEVLGTNRDEINKQQEIVAVLKEQLEELEIRREKLITNVIDLRRAMEEIPLTPEVTEAVTPTVPEVTGDAAFARQISTESEGVQIVLRELRADFDAITSGVGRKYQNTDTVDEALKALGCSQKKCDELTWFVTDFTRKEVAIPKAEAVTPEEVQGTPMPDSARQELLTQADAWLEQTGKREPNSLHVIGIPEGEALIRTDSEGKPMMVATLLMREDKLTLSTIVTEEPGKIANGKALLDIINYLKPRVKSGEVFFPPRVEMSPVALKIYDKLTARLAAEKEVTEVTRESLGLTRIWKLPREPDFIKDLEKDDMATRANSDIARNVRLPRRIRELLARAERSWEGASEEDKLAIAKRLKLGKPFISKSWFGMSSYEKRLVALDYIPDNSLHFSMMREIFDMEEFHEFLEEAVPLPFTALYEREERVKRITEATKEYLVKEFSENTEFRNVLLDEKQLDIATQELNARNEIQGVEHPEDITPEQLALVEAVQEIYDQYKTDARYLEFTREKQKIDALKKRFPDAVKAGKESELVTALELWKSGDLDALYTYLKGCTWGVIDKGFDPRQIAFPDLRTTDVHIGYVRGENSLEMRTRVEFPGGRLRRNLVGRMLAYVTQMEIQMEIEPELSNFQKLWNLAFHKFDNKDEIQSGLNRWWRLMQGIPSQYGWWDKLGRRAWRQGITSVFIEPVLSLRNFFQAGLLHKFRTELIRWLVHGRQDMSPFMRVKSKRYFDIFVSQLGGIRKYVMLTGQPGLPGLGWLNRIADSLNIYGWSDYIPRLWSFYAYMNKAWRATEQYMKDHNVEKWLKNSGASMLRHTEQNFVLTHYLARADDMFDLRVDALESVTGAEMAAFYVARRGTDKTHFKYARWARGIMEMGALGETLWNLFVFPRGYGQRVFTDAEMIVNLFKGEATWQEARGGFNDLLKLFIAAQIFSSFWTGLTGRKRNPYDPFSILTQWTFGGLFIGAAQDMTKFFSDAGMAANPAVDPELREQAKGRLPGSLSDLGELFVPFYRRIIDIWAAVEDTPDQDVYWLRKMREQFEKDYTIDDLEQLDMTLWERMTKAFLGAAPEDPGILERAQTAMQESRDKLGTREISGKYYTLKNHATVVASATKGFPNILTSEYAGSNELDIFFKDCETQWEEYYMLPTSPSTIRKDWRLSHVEEEAMMLFWEKFSQSVFPIGSQEWEEVARLLLFWFSQYSIDQTMHKEWANWGLDLTK